MPSIKKNVVFNYMGHFYVAVIGILTLPFYLRYLGAEAYGLVGFFTLLQSWIQLMDMGMSPTLGREVARLQNATDSGDQLRTVVRSLELIFLFIACAMTIPLFLARDWVAAHWLETEQLSPELVGTCIGVMTLMVGVRWLTALHRSGINAYEQQVWLNKVTIVFNTLRFPGSLLVIIISKGDILAFFCYQLALSIVEQVCISRKFYRLLPKAFTRVRFSREEVKRIAPFALSVAYTGGIWIFITQLDKLLLSKILTLAHYGYFTLAIVLAAGIMILSGPVSTAVLPRMTALLAENKEQEMLVLYCKATRFVVCMVTPITLMLALFAQEVMYIWTADQEASKWAAPVLPLFLIGNGLLAIGAFQYYLQYAHGRLRLHVQCNTVSAAISIPLITYAAFTYGAIGVGYVWLGFRFLSLIFWTPYVHGKLAPSIQKSWMFKEVFPPFILSCLFLLLPTYLLQHHFPSGRLAGLLAIGASVALATIATLFVCFNQEIRGYQRAKLQLR